MEDVEVVRAYALALSIVRHLGPWSVQFYRTACLPSGAHNSSLGISLKSVSHGEGRSTSCGERQGRLRETGIKQKHLEGL